MTDLEVFLLNKRGGNLCTLCVATSHRDPEQTCEPEDNFQLIPEGMRRILSGAQVFESLGDRPGTHVLQVDMSSNWGDTHVLQLGVLQSSPIVTKEDLGFLPIGGVMP